MRLINKYIITCFFLTFFVLPQIYAQQLKGTYYAAHKTFYPDDSSYTCGFFQNGISSVFKDAFEGLIDSSGKILLAPQFHRILEFKKGIAIVRIDNQSGIADINGNIILHPDSVELQPFNTGFAIFKNRKSNLFGIVSDSGKIIAAAKYNILQPMLQGRAAFLRNQLIGLLTDDGREIIWDSHFKAENHPEIELKYGYFYHRKVYQLFVFEAGLAPFFIQKGDQSFFGFFDEEAKTVIKPIYEDVESFQRFDTSILAAVQLKGKWGLIDRQGNEVLDFRYDSPEELRRIMLAKQSERIVERLPNKEKQEKPLPQIIEKFPLFGNFFISSKHGKWGIVDNNGRAISDFKYDAIIAFDSNTAVLSKYSGSYSLSTGIPRYVYHGKYQYMDKAGKFYKKERNFSKVITALADEHHEEFVLSKGPAFFGPYKDKEYFNNSVKLGGPLVEYDLEENIHDGIRIVSYDNGNQPVNIFHDLENSVHYKKGLIDAKGKTIIPAEFDQITATKKPLLIVSKQFEINNGHKQLSGVIDLSGRVIIPINYDFVEDFHTAFLLGRLVGETGSSDYEFAVYDLSGKEIIPFSKDSRDTIRNFVWFNSREFRMQRN